MKDWGNNFIQFGALMLPKQYTDGQDFDSIFRQLVACYNALAEIEEQEAVFRNVQRNAPSPMEQSAARIAKSQENQRHYNLVTKKKRRQHRLRKIKSAA